MSLLGLEHGKPWGGDTGPGFTWRSRRGSAHARPRY